jgi:delta24(24(1))-sterol reductase
MERGSTLFLCNTLCRYATLAFVAVLHVTGTWRLTEVVHHIGPITSVAVISGNVVSFLVWAFALINKRANRRCGNFVYDFFMGIYLNPRIGNILSAVVLPLLLFVTFSPGKFDVKFFFELRVAWIMLFLITLAHALQQYAPTPCNAPPPPFYIFRACSRNSVLFPVACASCCTPIGSTATPA